MTDNDTAPLFSGHPYSIELEDELSRFVIGLAETVDRIQDAERTGSLPDVGRLARALALQAESFGYPLLLSITLDVVTASDEDKPEIVQEHLRALTQVALRIRRGHRGSA